MASGGHCGHGVRVWMQLRLVQCQASSASGNTEKRCQPMTKTLAWLDAARKDGSSNATLWWLRFLGVNMEIEILKRLLEQAQNIEAETGQAPTAVEALSWAIDEITHQRESHKQADHHHSQQPEPLPL